jgi:hypothetical protein
VEPQIKDYADVAYGGSENTQRRIAKEEYPKKKRWLH